MTSPLHTTQVGRWWPPDPLSEPPPERPDTPGTGDELAPWLARQLLERRVVFLRGRLAAAAASQAAAALLSLDTPGGAAVRLHLACADGDLDAALSLIDTIDGLRVPVHAVATGEVGGAAIGVYAAAGRRLAMPHARFRLAEPMLAYLTGTADQVTAAAGHHLRALEDLVVRVAAATGQPRSRVEDDFARTTLLSATAARDYGLVHELTGASPG